MKFSLISLVLIVYTIYNRISLYDMNFFEGQKDPIQELMVSPTNVLGIWSNNVKKFSHKILFFFLTILLYVLKISLHSKFKNDKSWW